MINTNENIAVSSRIRLARNIEGFNFPHKLDNENAYNLMKKTYDAINSKNNFSMHVIAQMTELERESYVEKHLISPNLAKSSRIGAVLIGSDKKTSIMLNEEDHIRAQYIENGFNLESAYKGLKTIDSKLSAALSISYDTELGYMTCCPTNLGTGMRASVMLFLPMLTISGEIGRMVQALARRYITVRGSYGEGSKAGGFMYQVSNQVSLGVSEAETLNAVTTAVNSILKEETRLMQASFSSVTAEWTDKIMRAKGILTNAYKLSTIEFLQLFSNLKIGITLGVIPCKDLIAFNKLYENILPANLSLLNNKVLHEAERDIVRAKYVREMLGKII